MASRSREDSAGKVLSKGTLVKESTKDRSIKPIRSATVVGLGIGALALMMFLAAQRAPGAVESLYSRQVYPLIASTLAQLSALVPFSIGELLLLVVPVVVLWGLVAGWRAGRRAGWGVSWSLIAALLRGVARLGVVWFVFLILWGLNYSRLQPEMLFQLTPPRESEETKALIENIGRRLDELRGELSQDDRGVALMPGDLSALDAQLRQSQADLLAAQELPVVDAGRVKKFESSPLLLRWGVSGMYGPFTGEPQLVLPAAPTQLPFTLAHERAHLSGFAWEEAASFVGLLTCWNTNDPRVQYSAWLSLWISLRRGPEGREPGVQRDLRAISQFVVEHRGREAPALWGAYGGFLSAHGVKGGTRSYGRVAGLALAWLSKHGLPPE